jgi:hypothetical protein
MAVGREPRRLKLKGLESGTYARRPYVKRCAKEFLNLIGIGRKFAAHIVGAGGTCFSGSGLPAYGEAR